MVDFIKRHLIWFMGGGVMVVLLLIMGIVSINMLYSATLDIVVVPTEAKILINGEEYKNGVYQNVRTGKAKVNISLDGFETQEFEIELKRDERTRVYTYLEGDAGWYEGMDEDSSYLLDIINEYKGEQQTVELKDKYPIMSDIPIVYERYLNNYTEYVSYRIDGGEYEGCEQEFCLKITDISGGNYERALKSIREKGYNPSDYEIIYEDVSQKGHA